MAKRKVVKKKKSTKKKVQKKRVQTKFPKIPNEMLALDCWLYSKRACSSARDFVMRFPTIEKAFKGIQRTEWLEWLIEDGLLSYSDKIKHNVYFTNLELWRKPGSTYRSVIRGLLKIYPKTLEFLYKEVAEYAKNNTIEKIEEPEDEF